MDPIYFFFDDTKNFLRKTRPLVNFSPWGNRCLLTGQRVEGDQMGPLSIAGAFYTLSLWATHHTAAQTVAVNLDSDVFVCSSDADCSEYFKGDQTQGEW